MGRKQFFVSIVVGIVLFFGGSISYAQSSEFCSFNQRGSVRQTSFQDLFPGIDTSQYTFSNRGSKVVGELEWYDNFANCTGRAIQAGERSSWNSYWSKNIGSVQGLKGSYSSNVTQSDTRLLQNYLRTQCKIPLNIDGKIGIQTLHAAAICATFKEPVSPLANNPIPVAPPSTPQPTSPTTPIVTPTTPIVTPTTPQDPSKPLVPFPSAPQDPNVGPPQYIDPTAPKIPQKYDNNSCFDPPVAYRAVYNGPYYLGGINTSEYDSSAQDAATCSCTGSTKKVMRTLADKNGNPTSYSVSVCEKCDYNKCNCGVKLNTKIPFIGSCIMFGKTNNVAVNGEGTTTVNSLNAFPVLMSALIRILMSVILVVCFATIIVAGFMMTIPEKFETGKKLIRKVVYTIAGLGMLGLILYLINPNFFV